MLRAQQHEHGGQHEERSSDNSPTLAMELPNRYDGELLRSVPGGSCKGSTREEPSVADPSLLLDQFVMHDGNVSRSAAKGDPSQLEPKPECLPERRPGYPGAELTLCHSGSCELGCCMDTELL